MLRSTISREKLEYEDVEWKTE